MWCVGVLVLGMAAPRTPRLAQLGFLVVAGFLLVNKVYSPQYVLWLLPLAVLARPRWRDLLVWQAGEVFYFATVWLYLGQYVAPTGGGEAGAYWIAIMVRVLAQLWLVAVVVRDVLRPWRDPVDRPPGPGEPEDRDDGPAVARRPEMSTGAYDEVAGVGDAPGASYAPVGSPGPPAGRPLS